MAVTSSVVIHDLHVESIAAVPDETDPPLVVDANAVLTGPIPAQRFQAVGRWDPQVVQSLCVVDHAQLTPGHWLDVLGQTPRALAPPDLLGLLAPAALDHEPTITLDVI